MMTNSILPALDPERISARANGYYFMLHDQKWRLDKNTSIPVGVLHGLLEPESLKGLFIHCHFMQGTCLLLTYIVVSGVS